MGEHFWQQKDIFMGWSLNGIGYARTLFEPSTGQLFILFRSGDDNQKAKQTRSQLDVVGYCLTYCQYIVNIRIYHNINTVELFSVLNGAHQGMHIHPSHFSSTIFWIFAINHQVYAIHRLLWLLTILKSTYSFTTIINFGSYDFRDLLESASPFAYLTLNKVQMYKVSNSLKPTYWRLSDCRTLGVWDLKCLIYFVPISAKL